MNKYLLTSILAIASLISLSIAGWQIWQIFGISLHDADATEQQLYVDYRTADFIFEYDFTGRKLLISDQAGGQVAVYAGVTPPPANLWSTQTGQVNGIQLITPNRCPLVRVRLNNRFDDANATRNLTSFSISQLGEQEQVASDIAYCLQINGRLVANWAEYDNLRLLDGTYHSRLACNGTGVDEYPDDVEYIFAMLNNASEYSQNRDFESLDQLRSDFAAYQATTKDFIAPYHWELDRIIEILEANRVEATIQRQLSQDRNDYSSIQADYFGGLSVQTAMRNSPITYTYDRFVDRISPSTMPRLGISYFLDYRDTGDTLAGQNAVDLLAIAEDIFLFQYSDPSQQSSFCTLSLLRTLVTNSELDDRLFDIDASIAERYIDVDASNYYLCEELFRISSPVNNSCSVDIISDAARAR